LPEFRDMRIRRSLFDPLIRNHGRFKTFFVPSTVLMEHWDFRDYDVVLTSSATTAKYIRRIGGVHVCYCYFPTRALWSFDTYFDEGRRSPQALLLRAMLPYLQRRDRAAAQRVDHFVAISQATRQAIAAFYGMEAEVLHSPIVFDRFSAGAGEAKEDYFLLVSRLERWKRVDYAVEAFTSLGLPLHVVGTGPDERRLRGLAGPNVRFLGALSDDALVLAYGRARAALFTPELEYGLVPLEAAAAGTPVIAFGGGGVLETMGTVPGKAGPGAAVFFDNQTPEALIAAVHRFESASYDRAALVAHAETFSVPRFRRRLREIVMREAGARLTSSAG